LNRQEHFKNVAYRENYYSRKVENYHKRKHSYKNGVIEYERKAKEGPTYICVCCVNLFFKYYMRIFNKQEMSKSALFNKIFNYKEPDYNNQYWICWNCLHIIKTKKEVPALASSNGLSFP